MKKLLFAITFFMSALTFCVLTAVAEEIEELPPIMPQSYLGEKELDDSHKYAVSNAQGVLKQLEEIQQVVKGVKKDLKKGETGKDVQGDQKEIVEVLAEIIERNRPRQSKPQEDQEQDQQQQQQQQQGPPQQGEQQQQEATAASPAKDSVFRGGSNEAGELRKFVEEVRAGWGKLPKKERARMKQEMKQKFPKGHSDWIEAFTKAMSNGAESK